MPTPFMHLNYANQILEDPRLNTAIRPILMEHLPMFYLGNIAPDYQAICDIPRADTHFYTNPMSRTDMTVGYNGLLEQYPDLQDARYLPVANAVFQAAYNAHLSYDIDWLRMILVPFIFGNDEGWGKVDIQTRFKSHHSLLTYLDREALGLINETAVPEILVTADIPTHLPYLHPDHLEAWKYEIANQLQPNAPSKTVAVYSHRLKISPEEFSAFVDDPNWLEQEVFARIPRPSILVYQEMAQERAVARLNRYLSSIV